jgi:hypothetical protein
MRRPTDRTLWFDLSEEEHTLILGLAHAEQKSLASWMRDAINAYLLELGESQGRDLPLLAERICRLPGAGRPRTPKPGVEGRDQAET